ncbi:MAG: hypothetical protein H6600_00860 [Flavobacteriales bacterium]|nr:hypothetical protein [Flavobacteriales bacterium]
MSFLITVFWSITLMGIAQESTNIITVKKENDPLLGFVKVLTKVGDEKCDANVYLILDNGAKIVLTSLSKGIYYIEIPSSQAGKEITIIVEYLNKRRKNKICLNELGDYYVLSYRFPCRKRKKPKVEVNKTIACPEFP